MAPAVRELLRTGMSARRGAGTKLNQQSKIKMAAGLKLSSPATREFWEIPVLFEDEHLLAVDKPSGLLSSPDRYEPNRPSLTKLLHAGIAQGKPWAKERGLTYLMPAHRLDLEASGVMLLAKRRDYLRNRML